MFIPVTAMENVAVSWIIQHGRWSQVILKRRKDLHTIALFRWVLGWAGLLITFLSYSLPRKMFRNYCYILMKTERINYCIFSTCSECWHERKGNAKFPFWKRTLSVWILITGKQALFTLNNDRWREGREKVHLFVLLIRPPAWIFPAGENKQLKAASVIQDTKENIVKHVSGETVLEKFYFRRCQTKYMTTKWNGDGVNFQLVTLFKTHFWR